MVTSNIILFKLLVNFAENDMRTLMGRNLNSMQRELGCHDLTPKYVKTNLIYHEALPENRWKASCVEELLDVKSGNATL